MSFKLDKQYRLPGYDYSQPGFYFVTICTKNRKEYFGRVVENEVILSKIGMVAKFFWEKLSQSYRIFPDEFVVMPNHLHAVIQICEPCRTAPRRGLAQNLSIGENAPRRIPTTIKPLIKDSLSSMVNHFKGNVKRFCNQIGYSNFVWQAKFYDRIIWDEKALFKIREYIKTNPERWFRDRNNGAGIFM